MKTKRCPNRGYFLDGMFNVLESGEKNPGMFTRAGVMGYIQQFVQSSCRLESSPLTHLRRIFPRYKWQCHEFPDTRGFEGTASLIAEADFSWLYRGDGSCVTACLKGRERPLARCFFADDYCVGHLRTFLIKRGVVFATDDVDRADWFKKSQIQHEDNLCTAE